MYTASSRNVGEKEAYLGGGKNNNKMQILRCWPIYRRLPVVNTRWSRDYSITGLLKESLFSAANFAEFRDIRFRITTADDHVIMVWLVCSKIGSVQKQINKQFTIS